MIASPGPPELQLGMVLFDVRSTISKIPELELGGPRVLRLRSES